MAIKNTEQNINALLRGEQPDNGVAQSAKIVYKKNYYGISYDPEEHIYATGKNNETDRYTLMHTDDDFGFYLNFPIYKVDYVDKDHYFFNRITGKAMGYADYIEYTKTLFDLSDASNYKKLDTPLLNEWDGMIQILEFGKEYYIYHAKQQ